MRIEVDPEFLATLHAGTARARVILHVDFQFLAISNVGDDVARIAVIGNVADGGLHLHKV